VAIGDPVHRRRIATLFERTPLPAATIVHPRVEMSDSVLMGQGTIVCAGTVLTTNIHIGNHVQVNVGCTISHDAVIGDFTTLSPGIHVAGHVQMGNGVFIGIGASIINGRSGKPLVIGDGAIIAAGACVTGDVSAGAMVAGVPAVKKR
jgi:sugar O-acyltransferase (sialic acid O-acetyltransferase NeuD family)